MKSSIFTLLILVTLSTFSQTFTGSGGAIPDDGNSVSFQINVSSLNPSNIDTVYGLESVCINLTHTWDSDLSIELIAPDGTAVTLTAGNGGDGDGYINTCFNDTALNSVTLGSAPFTGEFRPQGDLGYINNGQNGNGQWILYILDTYAWADAGELFNWSITFGDHPAKPFIFSTSNLPIVSINTDGQIIQDEPKIPVTLEIFANNNGNLNSLNDFPFFSGYAAIELRGSSSQMFPKKSYGFVTTNENQEEIDTTLLGMPSESDWVLIANYTDKTLLRNVLTYKLFGEMGHYSVRTRLCELVINNQYLGIYFLGEKIKRGKNRIDIAKLNPDENEGDDLTGGYVVKIDKTTGNDPVGWNSQYPPQASSNGQVLFFQYEYPDGEIITEQQKSYIQMYVDSFETTLWNNNFMDLNEGWRKYADEQSFIDFLIINELSRNVDGYRLSTFFSKDKASNNGKIFMGPVWDFDIAWHNANYCDAWMTEGWAFQFGSVCSWDGYQLPFWWDKLLIDSSFVKNLKCRWTDLRTNLLDTTNLLNYLDSMENVLHTAQARNFEVWPILGTYVWPNPDPIPDSYHGEIVSLKKWIKSRIEWMDLSLMTECTNENVQEFINHKRINIYPNPANDLLYIEIFSNKNENVQIKIVNIFSENVLKTDLELTTGANHKQINIASLPSGAYMISIISEDKIFSKSIIKL